MKDTNLCKCNNCDSIIIDENPQTDAPLYDLADYPEAVEMIKSIDIESEDDDNEEIWACPLCLTDGYLTDNIN